MNKSVYFIFAFGSLGVMVLMMGMCVSFEMQSGSEASQRKKLGSVVRDHFKFESAAFEVKQEGDNQHFLVNYTTRTEAPLGDVLEQAEMLQVAYLTHKKYEGGNQRYIREIRVVRTELRKTEEGVETLVLQRTWPNPPPSVDLTPPDRSAMPKDEREP